MCVCVCVCVCLFRHASGGLAPFSNKVCSSLAGFLLRGSCVLFDLPTCGTDMTGAAENRGMAMARAQTPMGELAAMLRKNNITLKPTAQRTNPKGKR